MNRKDLKRVRKKRKIRVRNKIIGTPERPRLSVFRSLKNISIQAIDDLNGKTILSASTLEKEIKLKLKPATRSSSTLEKETNLKIKNAGNKEGAKLLGEIFGEMLVKKKIVKAIFDRGFYRYHGRIKALADAIREKGVKL